MKRRGREERRASEREKKKESKRREEGKRGHSKREKEGSKKRDEKEERGRLFGVRDLPLCVVCRRRRHCCVAVK